MRINLQHRLLGAVGREPALTVSNIRFILADNTEKTTLEGLDNDTRVKGISFDINAEALS